MLCFKKTALKTLKSILREYACGRYNRKVFREVYKTHYALLSLCLIKGISRYHKLYLRAFNYTIFGYLKAFIRGIFSFLALLFTRTSSACDM